VSVMIETAELYLANRPRALLHGRQYMEYNRASYPGGRNQYEAINFPPWWRDTVYHKLETAQHVQARTVAMKHTPYGHTKEQHARHRPEPSGRRQPVGEFKKLSLRERHREDNENSQASFIGPLLCPKMPPDSNQGRYNDRSTSCQDKP
jgi:hypothetical protein